QDGELVAAHPGHQAGAVLVPDSRGSEQLTALAGRILDVLERPFDIAGHRLAITASVGVVERSVHETTPADLVKDADATLYWSKADGRARWTLYDPARGAHQLTRQLLATALRPALERGEFTVEYQPLVGLADGAVHGAEALVRWRHPRYGTISPDRFIPLAEESGAIVPLGTWVLEESCRQAKQWLTEFPDTETFVSVNLAARQIWDSDVVADVARVLERTGLPARLLQLEITESALLGPGGRPLQALQALADMGVRIAIDDFGTGYSSLSYLREFPISILKIDKSFIDGLGHSAQQYALVEGITRIADTLDVQVIAEGIEHPDQRDLLAAMGCPLGQGYLFAHPMDGTQA
ncbi:GGDEF domain-containing phosphodiesterase, partial [Streptomyces sp. NPDC048209]|uniref:putative bifunctional diguanylate cyclase/phosphodiesterase n=1 Tax=Streptomyces sp. NPDC048209 TaxID=3156689 RepID=UPI00343E3E5D